MVVRQVPDFRAFTVTTRLATGQTAGNQNRPRTISLGLQTGLHLITQCQRTSLNNLCRDTAMPTHRVVASRPKRSLHLAARMAQARVFQHHTTNPERFAFQRQQIQARDHNVAPENLGRGRCQSILRGRTGGGCLVGFEVGLVQAWVSARSW